MRLNTVPPADSPRTGEDARAYICSAGRELERLGVSVEE